MADNNSKPIGTESIAVLEPAVDTLLAGQATGAGKSMEVAHRAMDRIPDDRWRGVEMIPVEGTLLHDGLGLLEPLTFGVVRAMALARCRGDYTNLGRSGPEYPAAEAELKALEHLRKYFDPDSDPNRN